MIGNMRDLGGLRTVDGRKIKPGMLIRSAHLAQAEEQDTERISEVIDLRTPAERQESPDRTYGCEYTPLPVFEEINEGISHEEKAKNRAIPNMAILYGMLIDRYPDAFRRILLRIMQHDYSRGAILWHCTEGKDRCGITSALVLEMLGVDRETILEDYLKTNLVNIPKAAEIHDRLLATHGKEFADNVYRAFIADESYLRSAWNAMGDNFITEKLGISREEIDTFRDIILEG
ncbi:MAG: tyrosine-protein phosphatase [Clostridia bacterium]|nr:tyrosine-protein phosphatase [Clostridia bacterium]